MKAMTRKHHLVRLSALAVALAATGVHGQPGLLLAAETETGSPAESAAQAGGQQPAQNAAADSTGTPERSAQTTTLTEHWLDVTPDTIERKTLVNTEGEKLGDVTGVVRHKQSGEIAAVVSMGGFLGIGWLGGREVAVPLDRMHLQANNVILFSPATRADLIEQEGEYRPDDYLALDGNTPLGELAGVEASPQPSGIASFTELDRDGNGALTRAESQGETMLIDAWETYDRNNDDRIDRAEFGQFLEEREEEATPPEV